MASKFSPQRHLRPGCPEAEGVAGALQRTWKAGTGSRKLTHWNLKSNERAHFQKYFLYNLDSTNTRRSWRRRKVALSREQRKCFTNTSQGGGNYDNFEMFFEHKLVQESGKLWPFWNSLEMFNKQMKRKKNIEEMFARVRAERGEKGLALKTTEEIWTKKFHRKSF